MRALIALLVVACGPVYSAEPSTPSPDPLPPGPAGSECRETGIAYERFHCDEGLRTPKGHTFEETCVNAAEAGIDLGRQVECVRTATSCDVIRACPR